MNERPHTPSAAEKARRPREGERLLEQERRTRADEPGFVSPRAWISKRSRERGSIAGDLMERIF